MNWIFLAQGIYILIIIAVCLRIIYDTNNTSKTLSYLLLTVFLPVAGVIIYFSLGTNYRKRKLYTKKLIKDEKLSRVVSAKIRSESELVLRQQKPEVQKFKQLARLLFNSNNSQLTEKNIVKRLYNGEEKFPNVLAALRGAMHHIHIEYYIFEDEVIGRQIQSILIDKARQGVEVRFIYDDFGSRSIRKSLVPEMVAAGVQCAPFYRVRFVSFANRINYRNHRKIIIVDGNIAFTGGINVSDRYINKAGRERDYWRDTHLRLEGKSVSYLQFVFLADWNFCAEAELVPDKHYFPDQDKAVQSGAVVQIAASGPDSDNPTILFTLLQAIGLAESEVLITTPYFIPGESLINELMAAALSGTRVGLLVPQRSDSVLVDAAARSYFGDLLKAGVEIYRYKKGFIHAKTFVADGKLSILGTANMDLRSFELNFEVNAVVYDQLFAQQLRDDFFLDLQSSEKIDAAEWYSRPLYKQFPEKVARLISNLL